MAQPSNLADLVAAELRKFPQLDPRAVLAIASHEGLGGGIGDNGTSFGPFQLHYGGAYPASAPHGSAAASQAWASSPAGIDYALSKINSVAGGLRGVPAIQAISSRFERPADVAGEVADATHHYGAPPPMPSQAAPGAGRPALDTSSASGPTSPPSVAAGRSSGLAQLLQLAMQDAHQAVFSEPPPAAEAPPTVASLLAGAQPKPASTPKPTGSFARSSPTPRVVGIDTSPEQTARLIERLSTPTMRGR